MNLNPIRRLLGVRQKAVVFPPAMKGPPEHPEYYVLLLKPGCWAKDKPGPANSAEHKLLDEKLYNLRRERYAKMFPDREIIGYNFYYQDVELDPAHMPKFQVLKRVHDFSVAFFSGVGSGNRHQDSFLLVPPVFKDALQSLDPNLCQFFPFEFRSRSGKVLGKFFIMHCPSRPIVEVLHGKSGSRKNFRTKKEAGPHSLEYWTPPAEDLLRKGFLVIKLPKGPRTSFYHSPYYWDFFSAALVEKLRPHLPPIYDFYPVHIEKDA
jgi:hypothetical protein